MIYAITPSIQIDLFNYFNDRYYISLVGLDNNTLTFDSHDSEIGSSQIQITIPPNVDDYLIQVECDNNNTELVDRISFITNTGVDDVLERKKFLNEN